MIDTFEEDFWIIRKESQKTFGDQRRVEERAALLNSLTICTDTLITADGGRGIQFPDSNIEAQDFVQSINRIMLHGLKLDADIKGKPINLFLVIKLIDKPLPAPVASLPASLDHFEKERAWIRHKLNTGTLSTVLNIFTQNSPESLYYQWGFLMCKSAVESFIEQLKKVENFHFSFDSLEDPIGFVTQNSLKFYVHSFPSSYNADKLNTKIISTNSQRSALKSHTYVSPLSAIGTGASVIKVEKSKKKRRPKARAVIEDPDAFVEDDDNNYSKKKVVKSKKSVVKKEIKQKDTAKEHASESDNSDQSVSPDPFAKARSPIVEVTVQSPSVEEENKKENEDVKEEINFEEEQRKEDVVEKMPRENVDEMNFEEVTPNVPDEEEEEEEREEREFNPFEDKKNDDNVIDKKLDENDNKSEMNEEEVRRKFEEMTTDQFVNNAVGFEMQFDEIKFDEVSSNPFENTPKDESFSSNPFEDDQSKTEEIKFDEVSSNPFEDTPKKKEVSSNPFEETPKKESFSSNPFEDTPKKEEKKKEISSNPFENTPKKEVSSNPFEDIPKKEEKKKKEVLSNPFEDTPKKESFSTNPFEDTPKKKPISTNPFEDTPKKEEKKKEISSNPFEDTPTKEEKKKEVSFNPFEDTPKKEVVSSNPFKDVNPPKEIKPQVKKAEEEKKNVVSSNPFEDIPPKEESSPKKTKSEVSSNPFEENKPKKDEESESEEQLIKPVAVPIRRKKMVKSPSISPTISPIPARSPQELEQIIKSKEDSLRKKFEELQQQQKRLLEERVADKEDSDSSSSKKGEDEKSESQPSQSPSDQSQEIVTNKNDDDDDVSIASVFTMYVKSSIVIDEYEGEDKKNTLYDIAKGRRDRMCREMAEQRWSMAPLNWKPEYDKLNFYLFNKPEYRIKRSNICYKCGKDSSGILFAGLKFCEYTGKYMCTNCMGGHKFVIPGRIVHEWDFSEYPINNTSYEYLIKIFSNPIISITKSNPYLYKKVSDLEEMRIIRKKLFYIREIILSCTRDDDGSSIHCKQLFRSLKKHYYEELDTYSLHDLVHHDDMMETLILTYSESIRHIMSCKVCLAKGSICKICKNKKPIFLYEFQTAAACKCCSNVYHIACLSHSTCPVCTGGK